MTKALEKRSEYAIMKPEATQAAEIFRNNLAGGTITRFDLEKIKVPTGGETSWIIQDAAGKRVVEEFEGIIIKAHNTRAYWKPVINQETGEEKEVMGEPPDCSSNDGVNGLGTPGGPCFGCPNAEWGTGKHGRGQACKLMRTIYILQSGSFLPAVINTPPSSYQNMQRYFTSLSAKMKRYSDVITGFTLEKDTNPDGIEYARIVPVMKQVLDEEEKAVVEAFIKSFVGAIEQKVDTSDYS